MATQKLTAIILAAGKGTRMKSPLPKVLHPVAGRPMIERVIEAAVGAGATDIRVVVGHGQNLVRQVVEPLGANCFVQSEQMGTAHAVQSARVEDIEGDVLILNGDHPLLIPEDLKTVLKNFRETQADLAVVTCEMDQPGSFGRIVRHHGAVKAIVESKDASAETLKIREINTGVYVTSADVLQELLPRIRPLNKQKELYLTDLVSLCVEDQRKVEGILAHEDIACGVNSQSELAQATRRVFLRKVSSLMDAGVIIIDPEKTYVEDSVDVGPGSVIYPNVFLRGRTQIASFCVLEPNVMIIDSALGESTQVRMGSYFEKVQVGKKCFIGPYARLRPDTVVGDEAHIGNFVELKKVKFGPRSKANHLAYLGDAEIGEDVNIGCGTITCNYAVDRKKYKTKIGDRVFVGSDTQFVAPVEIGEEAIIGSGSTITKNVPAGALAVVRGELRVSEGYVQRLKKKMEGR
jgi:bifunctional UDP-N-acetylglucosamine pyrophosphorylase/glucosamine-1-phosphate N-acetyltransferase